MQPERADMSDYSTSGNVSKLSGLIVQCVKQLGGDPDKAHRFDIRHGAPRSEQLVTRNIILIAIEVEQNA